MPGLDDDVAGILSVIESDNSAHEPVDEPVDTTPVAEGTESTTEPKETQEEAPKETSETEVKTEESSTSAEGQTETKVATTDEPSKTETTEQDFSKWKDTLPLPPPQYFGKLPEYDEEGNITNMTHPEYQDFLIGKATEAATQTNYTALVEQRSYDIAEQVLPEMKTDTSIRELVKNVRLGSLVAGTEMDNVQAAILIRDALGLSPSKIAAYKAEGANNAKASVTIQKAAALETGSTEKKSSDEGEKVKFLQKRIAKGDDEAFAELFDILESR